MLINYKNINHIFEFKKLFNKLKFIFVFIIIKKIKIIISLIIKI